MPGDAGMALASLTRADAFIHPSRNTTLLIRTDTQPAIQARGLNRRKRDNTDESFVPDGRIQLPHERDESPQAQNTSNPVICQGWRDSISEQQVTDRRGQAVEAFRDATGGLPVQAPKPAAIHRVSVRGVARAALRAGRPETNDLDERGGLGFAYRVIRLRAFGVGPQWLGWFVDGGAGCVFFIHGSTFSVSVTDRAEVTSRPASAPGRGVRPRRYLRNGCRPCAAWR